MTSHVKRPNIVLIVLDSVRAESTSLYGYARPTTPFLESIAERSVVYNAFSTTVTTVPAHASMFTGTHVSTHGLFVDGHRLSSDFRTMAEILADAGYRTFGVCYQDDVSPATGLHRGFQQFEMEDEPSPVRRLVRATLKSKQTLASAAVTAQPTQAATAARPAGWKDSSLYKRVFWEGSRYVDQGAKVTMRKTDRFLRSASRSDPFFLYLHYDEAHLPYRPPVPFRNRFMGPGERAAAAFVNQNRSKFFVGDAPMNGHDFSILRALYDGAIAYLDAQVARVYRLLNERNCLDNTVVIVMGDHGDNVGEHGLMSHKFCVYDTLTRIPLLITYPRGIADPGRPTGIVQHTDLLPTVLELVGIREDSIGHALEGNSLISSGIRHRKENRALSELFRPFGREALHLRARMAKYDRRFFALRSDHYKYIWASDGSHEFYDMVADPMETRNLLPSRVGGPALEQLRALAEAHRPAFEAMHARYGEPV